MYCSHCGKQLPDGVNFCRYCGAALSAGTTQATGAPGRAPEESASPRPRHAPPPDPRPAPSPAPAGGLVETMRQQSIRSSILPLLLGLGITVLLFAAGGPQLGLAMLAILAVPCAIPMIKALSGAYQKDALALLQEEDCFDQAERFFASATPVNGVYMGRQFVYFQQGRKSVLLRPWDVAWAYHHVTRHYALFIPMGSSHSVLLRTMAGKQYVRIIPKQECQPFLEAVKAALPGTVTGYSAQLEQAYTNDRKAFAALWEQKVPGCTAGHAFR